MNDRTKRDCSTEKGWRQWISFGRLIESMNSLGTGWIFVLLILVNTDIVGRTVFNKPVRGVAEIVGMTIVACVFLQLAYAIREDRLTRSEIILERLGKHLQFRRGLEAAYNLLGFFILAVLFVYSIPLFTRAWAISEFVGAEGDFMAPVWPVKFITVIGSLLAALQCLFNFYRIIKEIIVAKSLAKGGPT
jgi:TRAP-type mannitol/chloroaromatic compound transport system permease small subunit